MSFISEFTSDIRHVKGVDNEVADALSRIESIKSVTSQVDVVRLAEGQKKSNEVQAYMGNTLSGLVVQRVKCGERELVCDVSTGRTRPIVPLDMRREVFDLFHGLAHAGPRPTQRAILRKYVWKNLKKDIVQWCKACHACQASKVSRHIHSPVMKRLPPDRRFGSIHVDLVGPLPECEGFKYLFTIVDRWTRWPEAIPVQDMTAQSCARALLRHWVARFGIPYEITADRGRQFTSELWKQMGSMLGIKMNNTTSYHPQANGLVERLHRQLKGSIMARDADRTWMDHLPMAMLGIRTAWRTELDCSPAELVYGTSLTVPGLLIGDQVQEDQELPNSEFVEDLLNRMKELRPVEMAHHTTPKVQVPSTIAEADYVYVRTDAVRQPLVRPYTGPFKVVGKSAKYFTIYKNGKTDTVSLDRLKPAFFYENNNIKRQVSQEFETKATKPRVSENKERKVDSEREADAVTQPLVANQNPETVSVPEETREVATKTYRDALCGDPSSPPGDVGRPKQGYQKRKPEVRNEPATLRSRRVSRPPVRS